MNREIINAQQENEPKRRKPNAVADTVSYVLNKAVAAIAASQHLPTDMSTRKPPRKQCELFVRIWTSWLHYQPFAVPITLQQFEELWRAMAPAQMTRFVQIYFVGKVYTEKWKPTRSVNSVLPHLALSKTHQNSCVCAWKTLASAQGWTDTFTLVSTWTGTQMEMQESNCIKIPRRLNYPFIRTASCVRMMVRSLMPHTGILWYHLTRRDRTLLQVFQHVMATWLWWEATFKGSCSTV